MSKFAQFRTGYMDDAVNDLPAILRKAARDLKGPLERGEFDTLVGTGFSGGVVIPALAMKLKVKYVLIRKESDDSHHGAGRLLGNLGERWIFVDDFVSSGETKRRVLTKVGLAAALEDHTTAYAGDYLYARDRFGPFSCWVRVPGGANDEENPNA